MMMSDIEYTVWRGEYRHVRHEITSWVDSNGQRRWAAAILTHSLQVVATYETDTSYRFPVYTYEHCAKFNFLNRAVNGKAVLTVMTAPGEVTERYRLGWDYMHSWDEFRYLDKSIVLRDVQAGIDALWMADPNMSVWCVATGKWCGLSEGYETAGGGFISKEGIETNKANGWANPELVVPEDMQGE